MKRLFLVCLIIGSKLACAVGILERLEEFLDGIAAIDPFQSISQPRVNTDIDPGTSFGSTEESDLVPMFGTSPTSNPPVSSPGSNPDSSPGSIPGPNNDSGPSTPASSPGSDPGSSPDSGPGSIPSPNSFSTPGNSSPGSGVSTLGSGLSTSGSATSLSGSIPELGSAPLFGQNPGLNSGSGPGVTPTTFAPVTPYPSAVPSYYPTGTPSRNPSVAPTTSPSASQVPTTFPSSHPSKAPSELPSTSFEPSDAPSSAPSQTPTSEPSEKPSSIPTSSPSSTPSVEPSVSPSYAPSATPTSSPTSVPSLSLQPSATPSTEPTLSPTSAPSSIPTAKPTPVPTVECIKSHDELVYAIDYASTYPLYPTTIVLCSKIFYVNHEIVITNKAFEIVCAEKGCGLSGYKRNRIFRGAPAYAVLKGITLVDGLAKEVESYGGAIYLSGGTMAIDQCDFVSNSAVLGGAIFSAGETDLTISRSSFTNNHAGTDGGAIYISEAKLKIDDSVFSYNEAGRFGGAIFLAPKTLSYFYGVDFLYNKNPSWSEGGGGALALYDAKVSLANSAFDYNSSPRGENVYVVDDHDPDLHGSYLSCSSNYDKRSTFGSRNGQEKGIVERGSPGHYKNHSCGGVGTATSYSAGSSNTNVYGDGQPYASHPRQSVDKNGDAASSTAVTLTSTTPTNYWNNHYRMNTWNKKPHSL